MRTVTWLSGWALAGWITGSCTCSTGPGTSSSLISCFSYHGLWSTPAHFSDNRFAKWSPIIVSLSTQYFTVIRIKSFEIGFLIEWFFNNLFFSLFYDLFLVPPRALGFWQQNIDLRFVLEHFFVLFLFFCYWVIKCSSDLKKIDLS
jgi:hypothetical protein